MTNWDLVVADVAAAMAKIGTMTYAEIFGLLDCVERAAQWLERAGVAATEESEQVLDLWLTLAHRRWAHGSASQHEAIKVSGFAAEVLAEVSE